MAMLRFRSEDADGYLFKIPRLGRHYQEVWDLEDSMLPFRDEVFGVQAGSSTNGNGNGAGVGLNRNGSGGGDRPRRFIPARDLTEDDLYDDARGLGGLTERITAGMMTIEDGENGDGHRDGDQSANTDGQNGDSATMMAMVKQEEDTNAEAGPGPTTIAINDLHKNGHHPSHDHHHPNERLNGFPTSSSDSEENEEIMIDTRWPIGPHSIGGGVGDGLDGSGSGLDAMNTAVDELEVGMKRELALLGLVEQDQEVSGDRDSISGPSKLLIYSNGLKSRSIGLFVKTTKSLALFVNVKDSSKSNSPSTTLEKIDSLRLSGIDSLSLNTNVLWMGWRK